MDPKISLGIDNCFACKRWTQPDTWMEIIRDFGISLVEVSADTECDPLYLGPDYMKAWVFKVLEASSKTGVQVVNFYSGHGTYSTTGLTHTEQSARIFFRDHWLKAQMQTAAIFNAGMGFFAHGIDETVLQSPQKYRAALDTLAEDLGGLAVFAQEIGLKALSLEQMYTPHQPPWTIEGARKLIEGIFEKHAAPLYLTLDLGHMNGQQYFQKPERDRIIDLLGRVSSGVKNTKIWLGPKRAMDIFIASAAGEIGHALAASQIEESWQGFDYLFARPEDCSVDRWLENLACYSPIIHLQQSDGKSSPHWSFSPERNAMGIIDAAEVMKGIAKSYSGSKGIVPKCGQITLTLEPFIGTMQNPYDALLEIKESIRYWRRYVPRDDMPLSEVLANLP